MASKRILLLLLILMISGMYASSQTTGTIITGTVREEGTQKPIRNVNIFFEGTLNGTTSDSTGSFTLYPQSNARLPILVTAVGYYPKTISTYSPEGKLIIDLKVMAYNLDAVVITANDGMSHKEKIRIFKREFLGTSPNAKECVILNEGDIRFTYSSQTHILKATCDKPLIIHNKNLGYTLNFLLSNFIYANGQTSFYGSQFFLEDVNPVNIEKIEKARKTTYGGSRMHFIRSLWNNTLENNGFKILRKNYELKYDDIVVVRDNKKYIHLEDSVQIVYKWTKATLYKAGSGNDAYIERDGYTDPAGLVWGGLMGAQRAGDMLPLEYNAKEKLQDNKELTNIDLSASLDTLRKQIPVEKLYIHLDKPYYSPGDTLRLKAYLLDAATLRGSEKSGIIYLELANDSNKVLYRRMLAAGYGLATGNIVLDQKAIPAGSYTLRAYTSLMRNFGEGHAFEKSFYISSGITGSWLVNFKSTLSKALGKDNLHLALQLSQVNKVPLRQQELDIRVLDGKRVIHRGKVKTDAEGKMDFNFNLPENAAGGNISLLVADPETPAQKVTVPVSLNRAENIDLQFMPEGGNLVSGIPSRVGFKAIAEDGNAVDVTGKIYNNSNEEVASFASSYKGMGSFELKPLGTSAYTAKIIVNGTTKSFPLPEVKSTGSVLRIRNLSKSDSVEAIVTVSTSLVSTTAVVYHLVAQSGGIVRYDEIIPVNSNTYIIKRIDKDIFPTGLVRFTLMNAQRQALNERIIYIDHNDQLDISVNADKTSYQQRDSIALNVEVKDHEGRPVQGSFSMAITDDSQVKTDSLSANILTTMLLTSGLKGTVEAPGHYLLPTEKASADLDHLLLTQGWVGYDWKDVFSPSAAKYPAEAELTVRGRVSNVLNKGLEGTVVQLASLKPAAAKTGITGKDGSFRFSGLPAGEDLKFFLQARNKNNKTSNVGIEMDEFKVPVFAASKQRFIPWYVNTDTVLLKQAGIQLAREQGTILKGANLLQEVVITEKKIVKDSKNLNGAGESDQMIGEEELANAPKKTLLDLMQEKVAGFGMGIWPGRSVAAGGIEGEGMKAARESGSVSFGAGEAEGSQKSKGTIAFEFAPAMSYIINHKEMHLIIDGVDVESFYVPVKGNPYPTTNPQLKVQKDLDPTGDYILERNMASPNHRRDFIKQFLDGILAEDIKGIEVMYSPKYNARYKSQYAGRYLSSLSMISADFTYVEVTTYSGNGSYINKAPGRYLYKPMSFVNSASFYRPKYISKANPLKDLRSTIHWEPDIVTDKDGKATVSFYSADIPGSYSVIMEGSNMNGSVGRKTAVIKIK